MPDPDIDVELPLEDAAEQEQLVAPESATPSPPPADGGSLEANEADYAEQQTVVGYDDEEYR